VKSVNVKAKVMAGKKTKKSKKTEGRNDVDVATPTEKDPWAKGGRLYYKSRNREEDIESTDGDHSRGRDKYGRLKYMKPEKGKKPSEGDLILRFR
jgi:hypothetical protein